MGDIIESHGNFKAGPMYGHYSGKKITSVEQHAVLWGAPEMKLPGSFGLSVLRPLLEFRELSWARFKPGVLLKRSLTRSQHG